MASKRITELGQSLGWYLAPRAVFGLYEGFQVNLLESEPLSSPKFKSFHIYTSPVGQAEQAVLTASLEELKQELKFKEFVVTDNLVVVTHYEQLTTVKADKLKATLERTIGLLRSQGIEPHFEETRDDLAHYVVNGAGVILPRSEAGSLRQSVNRDRQERENRETSYGQGALGGFLFGMGGVAVWVAIAYFFSLYFAAAAIGIAFLSYLGYQQFNGVTGPLTKPVLAVLNLVLIFLAVFLTFHVLFLDYESVSLTDTWNYVTQEGEIRSSFLADLGFATLFMVIGIWSMVGSIDTKGEHLEEAQRA